MDENELPSDPEKEAFLILTPVERKVGGKSILKCEYKYYEGENYIEIGQWLELGEEVSKITDYYRELARKHGRNFDVQSRPIREQGKQLGLENNVGFEGEVEDIDLGDSDSDIDEEEIVLP
jgi:hypothetical protein